MTFTLESDEDERRHSERSIAADAYELLRYSHRPAKVEVVWSAKVDHQLLMRWEPVCVSMGFNPVIIARAEDVEAPSECHHSRTCEAVL
jgi:hypothetical protein